MKKFFIIIIGILVIAYVVIYGLNLRNKQNPSDDRTAIGKKTLLANIYTYYGFRLPIKLDQTQAANSLVNSSRINIAAEDFCEQTASMAEQDHWQIVGEQNLDNSTSFVTYYFSNKSNPAVEFYCHWNTNNSTFDNGTITFIAANKIGSWLLKIKSNQNVFLNDGLNIEDLLECNGTIIETKLGVTECS